MRRTIFSIIWIAALLVCAQAENPACTCSLPLPKDSLKKQVKKALTESRAVFAGKVLEINESPQAYSVVVRLKVEQSWKGLFLEEINIVTGRGGGDCGYRFEVGESYIVYAYGPSESILATDICQRTAKLTEAREDLKVLGKGKVALKVKA